MPKYSVRFYSEYCDEYEVEAPDAKAAVRLAEEAEVHASTHGDPALPARFGQTVVLIERHVYVDASDTCISKLDEDGNWLDEED